LHARRGDYLHGVCFVELGALTRPDALPETIAAALGLRLPEDDDAPAALARTVASLTMLIALDNAEHLLEAVGACAGTLLRTAPGVRLLVTSQVPLRVAQEVLCPLGALAVPSTAGGAREALAFGAVALFMARARAQAPRFVLDDGNVAGVVEVCRRLDGAALAIELAAARLSLLGLHGLLSSLSQPLALLTKGRPDAPARQRTLRAALQWSHDLLAPDEQAVFRRLSVFAGSATLPMIRQVLTDVGDEGGAGHVAETVARTEEAARGRMDSWAVLEALGGLVDRSMAYTVSTGCGVDDIPRYGLLDTPRALAAERLGASGEAPALRARHAGALGALMAQVFDDLIEGPRGLDEIRDALWPDLDNAQAALGWARTHDATLALVIASTLSLVLGRERHAERVTLWREVEPLLDDAAGVPDAVLGRACRECAEHWATTRTAHARERAMQAHALAVQAGDLRAAYLAAGTLAPVSWRLGDLPTIQFAFDVVRAAGTPAWSPFVLAQGAATRAWHCTLTKDTHGALHGFGEQARLCRAAGMDDVRILNNVAGIHLSVGQTAEAIDILQALAGRVASDRDPYPLALTLSNLSASLLAEGRAAQAREVVRQSWPLARQYEMHPQWADDAALIAALEGRAQAALRLAGFADREFERLGQPREAVDQVRIDRAVALASRALSATHDPEALSRLRAAGATLTLDELPTLAFDADSSRINRH
jgi:predicted ATPase